MQSPTDLRFLDTLICSRTWRADKMLSKQALARSTQPFHGKKSTKRAELCRPDVNSSMECRRACMSCNCYGRLSKPPCATSPWRMLERSTGLVFKGRLAKKHSTVVAVCISYLRLLLGTVLLSLVRVLFLASYISRTAKALWNIRLQLFFYSFDRVFLFVNLTAESR